MSVLNRDYESLLYLYEERNITRAAQRMGMQQPGLSKLLSRLEDQMGRKLFSRKKDGLIPTAFVEKLVREIQQMQDQWNSSYRQLLEQENRIEGDYKLGCHPVIASSYLSKSYTRLLCDHPGLKLELVLKPSLEVTHDVIEGHLQFGLVANPMYHPDLVIRQCAHEFSALWSHGTLKSGDVVFFNPDMLQIHQALKSLKNYRLLPVRDYQLIFNLLLAEESQAAILPSSLVGDHNHLHQISDRYYETEICLIHRADLPRTAAFREISERLRPHQL